MANKIMTISGKLLNNGNTLVLTKRSLSLDPSRNFLSFTNATRNRKSFNEKKLVGFSMEQLFDVVSDVENYHKFVPFCKKSLVHSRQQNHFLKADLVIGFPPITESYTSHVSLARPYLVKAECKEGRLFNYLLNYWKFSPGLKDIPNSCVLDFQVTFEFKSVLHTQLSLFFFDQLVKQMEEAFFREAQQRYGQPSIRSHVLLTNSS